jgi:hypothetical protein
MTDGDPVVRNVAYAGIGDPIRVDDLTLSCGVGVFVVGWRYVHFGLPIFGEFLEVVVERSVLLQNDHEMIDGDLFAGGRVGIERLRGTRTRSEAAMASLFLTWAGRREASQRYAVRATRHRRELGLVVPRSLAPEYEQ